MSRVQCVKSTTDPLFRCIHRRIIHISALPCIDLSFIMKIRSCDFLHCLQRLMRKVHKSIFLQVHTRVHFVWIHIHICCVANAYLPCKLWRGSAFYWIFINCATSGTIKCKCNWVSRQYNITIHEKILHKFSNWISAYNLWY